ncbi:uncharacterized protein LOC132720305 [Ruditapes philippinarum]|uniref:uncharacterized protein LOC132720305 n=1 Tax=Ruditapes philippinarum TaxID=129788 RepID=UPI00295BAD90|nr:uncharacterized protein LOC132720305 [Ruditapes philippinarum]XP_060560407.1 uncharacterized protein LOC132720305 [Ruditapes philippinarum]
MEACNETQSSQSLPAAWQHAKALGDCMIKLYENKLWTDVKFRCKDHDDNERIHAHKIVLAARSPVFQAMLFGPCAEENEEILLDSIEAETFDLFLRYAYMDKVTLTEDLAAKVLETAHYYQVTNLVQFCADVLASCVKLENVCDILSLARRFEVISLCKACCIFIDQNADQVIKSEGFLKLTKENLDYILMGDTLYGNEESIFKKTEEWAQKKLEEGEFEKNGQNTRKLLGLSFFYLRLPTMSSENFLQCTRRKGYLSIEEYEDIADFINKVPGTTVTSNSCVSRVPIKEQWNLTCGEVTDFSNRKRFEAYVSRDIKLKAFELSEIHGYLQYYSPLYSKQNAEWVEVPENNTLAFLRSYNHAVVQIDTSPYRNFCRISETKAVSTEDLPDNVSVLISGTVKVTCQETLKGVRKDSEIFEKKIEFYSADKAQRVITLKEPIVLEKSRSPYTFTVNLENKRNNKVHLMMMSSSENVLKSKHGTLTVKSIFGNFSGIQSFCFEHISNRD